MGSLLGHGTLKGRGKEVRVSTPDKYAPSKLPAREHGQYAPFPDGVWLAEDFPASCLEKPKWAAEAQWSLLSKEALLC